MSFRIFITTDNHIGSHESNDIRREDASNTFDEIMGIAEAEKVDLVLQCGDLFDKNKPSKFAWYSTIKTLRRRCLGDQPVQFQVCNDNEFMSNDAEEFNYPNFEDENINIGLPLFAISGNHDDSGGSYSTPISPLDILSMTGMITHFGRVPNNTKIDIVPILMKKNGIKVALYGLANVRDERSYQTFKEGNVHFHRPEEDPDSWYNIMVVHQNRAYRGVQKLSPESLLPKFIDLVIWGHEHECLIDPQLNKDRDFYVMQPGSSVVTSYHSSEAGNKYVAAISIDDQKSMTYEKFMLKTVRPFKFRHIVLSEDAAHIDPTSKDARRNIMQWSSEQVEQMITEANGEWISTHSTDETPMSPLIRSKVDYSYGYESENAVRFGNTFANRVANPDEILHAVRRREAEKRWSPHMTTADTEALVDEDTSDINVSQVKSLMKEFLEKESLQILMEKDMNSAIDRFIEKDEINALKDEVSSLVQKRLERIKLEHQDSSMPRDGVTSSNGSRAPGTDMEVDDSGSEIINSSPELARQNSPKHNVIAQSYTDTSDKHAENHSHQLSSDPRQAGTRQPTEPLKDSTAPNHISTMLHRPVRTTRARPPSPQSADHDNYDDEDDESVEMFSSDDD